MKKIISIALSCVLSAPMLLSIPFAVQTNASAASYGENIVNSTEQPYTITYDSNGGSTGISSQTKNYGIDIKLSTIVPKREGYTFLGWNTYASAGTAKYQPGDVYEKDASVSLYAIWKAIPLVNETVLSKEIIIIGDAVKIRMAASGGTGEGTYSYAVYYKKSSSENWTCKQNYTSKRTVSISPAAATSYDVCVKVKDSSGKIEKLYFTVTVTE